MAIDFLGIFLAVESRYGEKDCQPEELTQNGKENHHNKHRELCGECSFIGKSGEGATNEEGENGDNHCCDNVQSYCLEFLEQGGESLRFCGRNGKS